MADNFRVLGQETVLQFTTPTEAEDVQQMTVQALPSGIVFNARLTKAEIDRGDTAGTLAGYARLYNQLAETPGVVGVSYFDNIDFNNRIVPRLSITIQSTSGRSTITRDDLNFTHGPAELQARIAEQVAQLDQVEAL